MDKSAKKARKIKSSAQRRSQVYQFRLKPAEHNALRAKAAEANQTVATFVRERVFA